MSRICLIDSRLGEDTVAIFKKSVAPKVYPVVIDVENDTFEFLLYKIEQLRIKTQVESIAYVAHASFADRYRFMNRERTVVVKDIAATDPYLSSWWSFIKVINRLRRLYRVRFLDMLGCSLAASADWQYIFTTIEIVTSIKVRASTDDTGNLRYKGDWILESTGAAPVDAAALYFNDAIEEFDGLLLPLNTTFDDYEELTVTAGLSQTQWTNVPGTTGHRNIGLEDNGYFPLISSQTGDGQFIIFNYSNSSAVLLSPVIATAPGAITKMAFIFSHDSDYAERDDRIEIYALPAAPDLTEEAILQGGTRIATLSRFRAGYEWVYGTWVNYAVLIPYIADEIQVAIRFIGEGGNNMYMDTIYFTEGEPFAAADPPTITAIEYTEENRLIVDFTPPENLGNPPITRYYIEWSTTPDFSADVNLLGHTDPSFDPTAPLTHTSEYIYFTKSPVYVRVSAYNGMDLNLPFHVPTPGPQMAVTVSAPHTLPVAEERLVIHFDSFTPYRALDVVAPTDPARTRWISLPDADGATAFKVTTTSVDPYMPAGYGGGGAWVAYTGTNSCGVMLSPKITAISGTDVEISFAFGHDSFELDQGGQMRLYLLPANSTPSATNLVGAEIKVVNRYKSTAPGLNTASWETYTVTLPNVTLGQFYLAAKFCGGSTNKVYFDNILVRYKFKEPAPVAGLTAYVSTNDIVVYWTHLEPGAPRGFSSVVYYQLSYKKDGDSDYTLITAALSTNDPSYYIFTPPDPNATYTFQIVPYNGIGPAPPTLTSQVIPCLLGSTRLLTPTGWQRVDRLSAGDAVVTAAGRVAPVKAVYSTVLSRATAETAPYRFAAGSIAKGYPAAAFDVSPTHAVAVPTGGWIIPKHAAMSGIKAKQHSVGERITYYHVEMPNYLADDLVLEAGAVVESFGAGWRRQQPAGTAVYTFDHGRKVFNRVAAQAAAKPKSRK